MLIHRVCNPPVIESINLSSCIINANLNLFVGEENFFGCFFKKMSPPVISVGSVVQRITTPLPNCLTPPT